MFWVVGASIGTKRPSLTCRLGTDQPRRQLLASSGMRRNQFERPFNPRVPGSIPGRPTGLDRSVEAVGGDAGRQFRSPSWSPGLGSGTSSGTYLSDVAETAAGAGNGSGLSNS